MGDSLRKLPYVSDSPMATGIHEKGWPDSPSRNSQVLAYPES
jgi:hypothetical protein